MTTRAPSAAYLDLIRKFPLRPLRTEEDLVAAIAMIDELTDRNDRTPEEDDYLEILAGLTEAFEAEHHPHLELSPVESLPYLISENQLTQARLAEEAGIAVATLSEILNGKRRISPRVRDALAKRFRVSPSLFV